MTQVLAITLESDKAILPETSSSRQSDVDFEKLYEQERSRILFPFQMFNFSSNFTATNSISDQNDLNVNIQSISKSFASSTDNMNAVSKQDIRDSRINSAADNNNSSANGAANETKVQASPPATARPDQSLRYFIGEIKVGRDLIESLISGSGIGNIKKIDMQALIAQIQDKIKMLKSNERVELVVQLKPDGLGTISMSVSSIKGIVSINIFADQGAKKALDDSIKDLESALKNANIRFDKLTVTSVEKDLHGNSRHG